MFHFDGQLRLTKADLAVDSRRRQAQSFVSHAHADHMGRHELALCTPETGKLYHYRLGRRRIFELPYRQPIDFGGLRLTTYPAGHCLGSAMLLAEDGDESLLYTGDFKLTEAVTCERAELPRAKILVIESTFGDPHYRLIPRAEAIGQLCELLQKALERGATPVIHAYTLGKSQEITRLLTDAGFAVLQHQLVYEISRLYEECGVSLGRYELYPGYAKLGHVVIAPPRSQKSWRLPKLANAVTFAVTGWAHDESARYRLGVDHAIPISDHADYDELLEAVARVEPREIYCTHGPVSFVDRLRDEGFNAYRLGTAPQLRLF